MNELSTAQDTESKMIIELRKIFYCFENSCRDSSLLQDLKIRLRHHIPESLQQHGREFQEIFYFLSEEGKITLGSYEFLLTTAGQLDSKAAKIIRENQNLIKEQQKTDVHENVSGSSLRERDRSFSSCLNEPSRAQTTDGELQKELMQVVHDRCANLAKELEQKYLEKEYLKQAQVANTQRD